MNTYNSQQSDSNDSKNLDDQTSVNYVKEADDYANEAKIPERLKAFIKASNIADMLEEDELAMIGMRCITGYMEDKQTQKVWLSNVEDAQRLARLTKEPKNTPLPQSANIKFPLITNACYQFAARTYPELIQDGKVVKCEVIGRDADGTLSDKADRVSTHMSYQLLGPNNDWEASTDKLLTVLPNVGFLIKKTYYDTVKKRNSSLVCNYKDIVIRNASDVQCLDDLRRITHDLYYHVNDLVEATRYGLFKKNVVDEICHRMSINITDDSIILHEQHRYLDLDHDGYEEPYIVTIEDGTNKVLRIVARYTEDDISIGDNGEVICITPIQFFTDFHFLRSTDGSFMSVGFGTLMLHLNETVNTILNQLIDAGTLANMQTGFIDSRLKIMGGQTQCDPGQWNRVKGVIGQTLKDGVMPINYKEPSQTLFQLLGMLIESGKELSSSTEVMSGQANPQNVPATTVMALVEQGMKVFNGIQRRLYSSLKSEYQKIFRLNKMYLPTEAEQEVVGVPISQNDYEDESIRVIPIADPNLSSDAQRMAKVQFLMNLMNQPATGQHLNMQECLKRAFIAINMPNPAPLLSMTPPPPDPKMLHMQAQAVDKQGQLQLKSRAQDLKEKEFVAKLAKMEAEIHELQAKAINLVSQASKAAHDSHTEEFNSHVNAVKTQIDATTKAHKQMTDSNRADVQTHLQAKKQAIATEHNAIELHQGQQQLDQQQEAQDNAAQDANKSMDGTPGNSGDASTL